MATTTHPNETIQSEFVTGLINAHAVEKQALQMMEAQISRIRAYPELSERMRRHLDETKMQEERLDRLLERFNESRSIIKDTVMSLSATMSSLFNSAADDEILKNCFANAAFENYELAAYESLVAMAETGGFTDAIGPLRQSLEEERAMSEWIHSNIPMVTQRYLELKATGAKADR